jgi:hypothetical protein
VTIPVPDCPVVGKLQLVPKVGAAKEKFKKFAPVILCAVIVAGDALELMTATLVTGVDVVPRGANSRIGLGLMTIVPGLIVKAKEIAGVGPPPGRGLVMVTVAGPAVVNRKAGT